MGFAYLPDGALLDNPELEPGETLTEGNTCAESLTCSAPMYFDGTGYLGSYSNQDDVLNSTSGEDDFGLDFYEPQFFHPLMDWVGAGDFEVRLRFTDAEYTDDMFYFCHVSLPYCTCRTYSHFDFQIHSGMSGRIKILDESGNPKNAEDTPELPYERDVPGAFDQDCGTFDLDQFQLPQSFCPERFVCDMEGKAEEVVNFAKCIEAMNCAQFSGMTTNVGANSRSALFMHQMIPHHQNAINMAKAMLETGVLDSCTKELLADEDETENCQLLVIAYEIINVQNFQIQAMRGLLEANENYELEDNCDLGLSESTRSGTAGRRLDDSRGDVCTTTNYEFNAKVNFYHGPTGFYEFEECPGVLNPTLMLERDQVYTIRQKDATNYYHPMGFAYEYDGALADNEELEPTITRGDCDAESASCPAPMYFKNGEYLGGYSNIAEVVNTTIGEDNFGLDDYEPLFFYPLGQWLEEGGDDGFSIKLKYDDAGFEQDFFYFCHVSSAPY